MGQSPYFKYLIANVLDTSEEKHLGGYTITDKDLELAHIRVKLFVTGTPGGSEQLRLNVYSRSDLDALVAQSNWIDVADFYTVTTQFLSLVRFDFNREFFEVGDTLHLALESNNYTRNGDSFYISFISDWPDPVNVPTDADAYMAGEAHISGYVEYSR